MKNIMLRIEGTQRNIGGEESTIELTTEGKLYKKENATYLVYEESEISGMEGCTTTVKVIQDQVSMRRFGTANSEIIFQKGKKYVTHYNTPYGIFDMEVLTRKITCNMTDADKGDIYIEYNISLEGLVESHNKLSIRIM
ncbi:DUF1934 domain-containing protein [Geosporobacter ferrireducens]|uniref:Calycin n=1 Tax=Geosporobacter ferrireducens TaxID=1424294 RepID=A0A1D8GGY2_9FIRM|nr:DUF1934 domain-containing protein [Geosporobacter ferrireducens]AOT70172.1 calycin [Geosporobacter ferrireducens]MTI53282.1 DUF1934 domain-containing protein [Geosporobacter ferrireducens]